MPAASRPRSSVFGLPADGDQQVAAFDASSRRRPRRATTRTPSASPASHSRCCARRSGTRCPRARGSPAPRARPRASSRAIRRSPYSTHRDARAEAPVHLRELEADVAAADDDQVLGQRRRASIIETLVSNGTSAMPVPGRQHRPAADVDEDARRLEPLAVDLDRVRRDEARMAPDQRQVRRRAEPLRRGRRSTRRRRGPCAP